MAVEILKYVWTDLYYINSKMSDKQQYTAEDIRLYLEGKMTSSQMHALERAALHDPFLADALEGIELHGDSDKFSADVEALNARLNARIKNRRGSLVSINSLWWKIAAVLFIVISGVAVIIFTGEKNRLVTTEYARTENKKEVTPQADTPAADAAAQSNAIVDTPEPAVTAQSNAIVDTPEPAVTAQTKPAKKSVGRSQPPAIQNESKAEESAAAANISDIAIAKDSVARLQELPRQKNDESAKITQALEGRVAGVNAADAEVDDSAYDEVVVVGSASGRNREFNKSKKLAAGQTSRRVIPANGWDQFEQYITDSSSIATADSVFTGEEHLAFTIGENGVPESIKILRSVSPTHDKEAIRLIRNGPAWKVVKGKRRDVKLKIIF